MNDYKPLENAVIQLLRHYPWYGQLIAGMDKRLTDKVPIAGVMVTSRVVLMINPVEFNPLPLKVQVGILLHECYHIVHQHMNRAKKVSKSFNKALNIAADRAINEQLSYLSRNNQIVAVIPDILTDSKGNKIKPVTKKNFQDQFPDKKVENNQDMEYYYKFLKDNAEQDGEGEGDFGGDMDTIDDHSHWSEGNGNEEVTREIIKKAMEKAAARSQGRVPSDVQAVLDQLNKSLVSWQSVLQRFVAKCTDNTIDSSRKRMNRRYGLVHPGTIKEPKLRLGVAIDSSGSVRDEYLNQFLGELKKIHALGVEIKVVIADAAVNAIFEYDPKKKINVTGRGGTAFQPAINVLEKANVDAIIYLTDGESDEDLKVRKPLLWGLCPNYTIPKGYTEKQCIRITEKDKK